LLAELRAQLDAAGTRDGQHHELSIAAPVGPSIIERLELAKTHAHLDDISWTDLSRERPLNALASGATRLAGASPAILRSSARGAG